MGATSTPMEIFNAHVFDLDKMKNYMPQEAFKKLVNAIEGGTQLDDDVAEAAACAMREWALSMGATHYTHWFQPRTEATAKNTWRSSRMTTTPSRFTRSQANSSSAANRTRRRSRPAACAPPLRPAATARGIRQARRSS